MKEVSFHLRSIFFRRVYPFIQLCLVVLISGQVSSQENPFAAGVRITDPLTPSEEKEAFRLPPGFEIELVASEPDIAKPMNMAFDAKGRLWVTDTLEYPFPVSLDQTGRDSIKVFTDTDKDGQFDKITTFAEGLNIPIGLYPYKNGVLAWSIPNIWWFEDTDGDGVADKREKRYGPLGWERDTHGMNSSFTRGFDGWLYATHGFNNNTTIQGSDGSEIVMNSGNTYRIQLDGTRVEQHTFGQVNPFGMCLDPLGNLYTADCHSAPVYQLLRGAYYPSFGKPHDGLGFAPTLMNHAHGSTAICGIVFYDDDQWPMEFRENVFIGNVMTSRLNRDVLLAKGSSRQAVEMPDLLTSKDPWFRPVNLQLGPDGSLYIADFYNRIIGHYEVPLKHPGRDRERGRIWKLTYKGAPGRAATGHGLPDFSEMDSPEIISELGHANITRRMLATHFIADHGDQEIVKRIRRLWNRNELTTWRQRIQCLWVMHRMGLVNQGILGDAVHDETMEVRTHAMHLLAERKDWNAEQRNWVLLALQDNHPNVQRAAANALSLHPRESHVLPLLKTRENPPADDPQWLHGMRLALRNQLYEDSIWSQLEASQLTEFEAEWLADVAVAVPSEGAGDYLVWYASHFSVDKTFLSQSFKHAARYASKSGLNAMAQMAPRKFAKLPDLQLELFESIRQGMLVRGDAMTSGISNWGSQLVQQILQEKDSKDELWSFRSLPGLKKTPNPWFIQQRSSQDGVSDAKFLCSLPPGGESFTGILRSPDFKCPSKFDFYLAGHDGYPDKARQKKNRLRLVDASTGEILRVTYAPRNDTAQSFQWDLTDLTGKEVALEIVDADEGAAYAWLAFGRLNPAVVEMPTTSPGDEGRRLAAAAKLAGELKLDQLKSQLRQWIMGPVPDTSVSIAAAKALGVIEEGNVAVRLADFLQNNQIAPATNNLLRKAMVIDSNQEQDALLSQMVSTLPLKHQQEVVNQLSNHAISVKWVAQQIIEGGISPLTLRNQTAFSKMEIILDSKESASLKELLAESPAPNHSVQDKIDHFTEIFDSQKVDLNNGQLLFEQACALCHQLNRKGAIIGPQLDGIGSRGLERVIEDILAPNRNIDHAFQTYLITLKDGEVISAMPRREEGSVLVVATSSGQEESVKISDIQTKKQAFQSLMPDNFGELFNDQQFIDLVGFLLNSSIAE
jgi:putative heme-binding domain-containing protein